MKAPKCSVCRDFGVIVGSLPALPVSAPLRLLPCPKRCPAMRPDFAAHVVIIFTPIAAAIIGCAQAAGVLA